MQCFLALAEAVCVETFQHIPDVMSDRPDKFKGKLGGFSLPLNDASASTSINPTYFG
jgi:hypothetical protein